jgi:hypothetical protein
MAKRAKVKKRTAKKAVKKAVRKPRKQFKVLDHDEPIVVDNGPVSISNRDAVVTLKRNGKRAERRCTEFGKLIVEKKDTSGMSLPDETFPLKADGTVNFLLFDPNSNKRDKIKVNRFGSDSARLESSTDLFEEFEDDQRKKLKMKGNAMARLTVIDADGTNGPITVILADANNNFLFGSVTATIWPVKH